jgi:hypothetical protein
MLKSPFLKLFGHSPVQPLSQHMKKAYESANLLMPFFQAVIADDWQQAATYQQQISELEHEADQYKRELRLNLPKSIFLPVPRTDILDLISIQDHIANSAKDIAGRTLGRKMCPPPEIQADFLSYLQRSIDTVKQANKAIRELGDLFEAGFSGNEATIVEEMVTTLDNIERETDEMQITIRQALFQLENTLPPVDVMMLYQIIEWIGKLADHAEKVGDRLQMFLAQ